jgi:hypothetical protein
MSLTIAGLTNTQFSAAAADRLEHHKVIHEKSVEYTQTGTVAAETYDLHIANGSGTLRKFEAAITETIATGADRTVTVDLHLGNTGSAFATVLSSTIGFTNGSTLRTPVAGAFSNSAIADGDILRVVVTVAGAAGNQAVRLQVTLTYSENPTTS